MQVCLFWSLSSLYIFSKKDFEFQHKGIFNWYFCCSFIATLKIVNFWKSYIKSRENNLLLERPFNVLKVSSIHQDYYIYLGQLTLIKLLHQYLFIESDSKDSHHCNSFSLNYVTSSFTYYILGRISLQLISCLMHRALDSFCLLECKESAY